MQPKNIEALEQTYAAYCCFTTYQKQIDLNKQQQQQQQHHIQFKTQEPFWLFYRRSYYIS